MRVLVTGAGGFLGSALSTALVGRGDTVIAFDLAMPRAMQAAAAANPALVLRVGDITDPAHVQGVLQVHAPDAVLHCAAQVGAQASAASPRNVVRVNLGGAINLFEGMRLRGIRRVIHLSSEEVYGDFQAAVATEDHPQRPAIPYGVTKLAVEHMGRAFGNMHGLECINLRVSWAYGPGLPRPRVPRVFVEAAVEGRPLHLPSGGDSTIDQTYIDDLVSGTLAALDHPVHPFDTYNLATGAAPPLSEVVRIIRDLVPSADISIGPGIYEYAHPLQTPRKGALDGTRAREAFGYAPKYDLAAGLSAYIDAHRRRQR
jgi:UDP-glucose 4-epimerase